jgi:Skp family chaperone for outer membrane proteins
VSIFIRSRPFLFVAVAALAAPAAFAQTSSPGYFMPPAVHPAPVPRVSQAPVPAVAPQPQPQAAQPQMPAIPQLSALPKEAAPPVAVIGVLSVPEVMQKSTAAQGVQHVIQGRQAVLAHDAQIARSKIQVDQEHILAERGHLTDAQLGAREQALRNQIAVTQTQFEERNQAIQNSGQAALGEIEAELIAIIRQEAEAHGMNLVLHREQVALNVNAFDITDEVVGQLNKLLPSVKVPPSVVTPGMAVNAPADQDDQGDQGDGQ